MSASVCFSVYCLRPYFLNYNVFFSLFTGVLPCVSGPTMEIFFFLFLAIVLNITLGLFVKPDRIQYTKDFLLGFKSSNYVVDLHATRLLSRGVSECFDFLVGDNVPIQSFRRPATPGKQIRKRGKQGGVWTV